MAFNDEEALLRGGNQHRVCKVEIVNSKTGAVEKSIIVAARSMPVMVGVNWVLAHVPRAQQEYYFVGIFDTGNRVEQTALWATEPNEKHLSADSFTPPAGD